MKPELITEAAGKLELVDIYLNDSRLVRKSDFHDKVTGLVFLQQNRREIAAEWLETSAELTGSHEELYLRALITLGLRFVRKGSEEASQPDVLAEMEATFCALYFCSTPLDEEQTSEFLKFNAVHNVWPFWREHVFGQAADARLPRPNVPLLKPR